MIPYGRQSISKEDIDAVVAVLKSDFLTQGPCTPTFEQAIANYCQVRHVMAVNSATSALHIACLALGVGPGDCVWTTPITFVASANCALYCGAKVDFVDIDPHSYNMSVEKLREKLVFSRANGSLPKVVIPVHLSGNPCDMASIHELAKEFGFKVIEDASHAIGGKYQNEPIGNCRFSDITVFSFHPVKIITTAEGGAACTNDADLANKMALLRSHGITRDEAQMTGPSDGPWYYQQIALGFNYRMTELQSALGLSQMTRLDRFVTKRHEIADRYDLMLANLPLQTPKRNESGYSGMHLYIIRLQLHLMSKTHAQVFDALRQAGIGVNLHYIPVVSQPYFQKMGFNIKDFPESKKYYAEAISLPMYPDLTNAQQDEVCALLHEVLK
jgi:UDP-4-amino-4,6-dideoxy-N-acetyl-beta-L-altrosamine transaminase